MADMIEYISWRGDLTWEQAPFNEVDGGILARFAYIPFERFSKPLPDGFTDLGDMAVDALADKALRERPYWRLRDDELLRAMADSRRYGDLGVAWPGSLLDKKLQVQFFAVTVRLGDGRYAVLFRGTDNTVVGWKEDLNMSYLCPIPGQRYAVEYLDKIAEDIPGPLLLIGHSKGGNLACFAGAFGGEAVQARIEAVYNFDGPGFFDNILGTPDYQRIWPRIRTVIPQFSVVGMLLGRDEESKVVHSAGNGLHQHDMYTWETLGPGFVHLGTVTGGSKFVDSALKAWIAEMTPEQFELFADTVYKFMADTNSRTLHQMRENLLDTLKSFAHSLGDMDEETRRAVIECVKLLLLNAGREVKEKSWREK